MVRIHSPRPEILLYFEQIRRLEILISNRRFAVVPGFVPTRTTGYAACAGWVAAGAGFPPEMAESLAGVVVVILPFRN